LFQYTLVPIKFLPIVMGTALVLVAVSTKRSLDGTPDEAELRRRVPAAAG
jgi:hypothetical protein